MKETASWIGGNLSASLSHVIQMIRNGHSIAQAFSENVYFALDRYFLTVPPLMELKALNESAACRLDVITRAKANCIALTFCLISVMQQAFLRYETASMILDVDLNKRENRRAWHTQILHDVLEVS